MTSVQQARISAESAYNGTNYSAALSQNNTTAGASNGLNLTNAEINSLNNDVGAQTSILYAITNSGPTMYAIYGRLVHDNTKYFCMDSTGSTSQSTSNNTATSCQ